MELSSDLLSQFVKAAAGDNKQKKNETTVYGTVVYNGKPYVKLDGSDLLTPISTTTDVKDGERVTVLIKDHTAVVTGNVSSPAARTDYVKDIGSKINEFEIIVADRVTADELRVISATIENLRATVANIGTIDAVNAYIDSLEAKFASLESVSVNDITALNAEIDNLQAKFGEFTDLSVEQLEVINAEIQILKGHTADFTHVSADVLEARKANIQSVVADKLDVNWANIDFANIDKATLNEIYAQSGLIENVTMEDGTVTGYLVGVTIKGDLIEGNTIVAEQLVIKGDDGLYYKLNTDGVTTESEQTDYNSLNGSVITARSITAEKVSVSDLVAFDATIGGFHITGSNDNVESKVGAIYSGFKSAVDSPELGLYFGKDGQMSIGDDKNYIRYYRELICIRTQTIIDQLEGEKVTDPCVYEDDVDEYDVYRYIASDGSETYYTIVDSKYYAVDARESYKLDISADNILFGDIENLGENVKIGTYEDPSGEELPSIELSEGDSEFKHLITNKSSIIMNGDTTATVVDADGIETGDIAARGEIRQGSWVWRTHGNGNLGLVWEGATE